MPTLAISSIYLPLFGIMLYILAIRIGLFRMRSKISLGDGNDSQFNKKIRGHMNFVETVPMTLMLIVLVEYNGANGLWVHSLFSVLLIARVLHYLQITGTLKPIVFRIIGMAGTFLPLLIASGWLLIH